MEIRPVTLSDLDWITAPLAELGAVTFSETFGHLYDPKDLKAFLAEKHSPEYYKASILDPDRQLWILKDRDELGGYMELRPVNLPIDPLPKDALEFGRLYFRNAFQGQGLGGRFIHLAEDYARDNGFKSLILSVYCDNFPAQKLYSRHGFEKIGEYDFAVGDHFDREWIMSKQL